MEGPSSGISIGGCVDTGWPVLRTTASPGADLQEDTYVESLAPFTRPLPTDPFLLFPTGKHYGNTGQRGSLMQSV